MIQKATLEDIQEAIRMIAAEASRPATINGAVPIKREVRFPSESLKEAKARWRREETLEREINRDARRAAVTNGTRIMPVFYDEG